MVMECIPRLSEDGDEVGVEDVDLGKSEPLDIDLIRDLEPLGQHVPLSAPGCTRRGCLCIGLQSPSWDFVYIGAWDDDGDDDDDDDADGADDDDDDDDGDDDDDDDEDANADGDGNADDDEDDGRWTVDVVHHGQADGDGEVLMMTALRMAVGGRLTMMLLMMMLMMLMLMLMLMLMMNMLMMMTK